MPSNPRRDAEVEPSTASRPARRAPLRADGGEEPSPTRDRSSSPVEADDDTDAVSDPDAHGATDVPRDTGDGEDENLLGFSILYPSRAGFTPVFVGTILAMFFWLVLPSFVLLGYFVRLTRAGARGEPRPPTFDDWGGMLVDGVRLTLVLLPIVIGWLLLVVLADQLHGALALVVGLGAAYPIPAMYTAFAVEDDWRAAFDIAGILEQVTTVTYLVGILLYVVVINGIGAVVATVLLVASLFTIVGWILLWPMIYYYWYAMDAALWGGVYRRIHGPAG